MREMPPDRFFPTYAGGFLFPGREVSAASTPNPGETGIKKGFRAERKPLVLSGWGTGIRTPIGRVRVCSPTVRRSPIMCRAKNRRKIEEQADYVKENCGSFAGLFMNNRESGAGKMCPIRRHNGPAVPQMRERGLRSVLEHTSRPMTKQMRCCRTVMLRKSQSRHTRPPDWCRRWPRRSRCSG